ncbi:MAG: acyl-ACP--UDP-N-acetylglucosamine O-acyltransferase [Candidatus Omnitrophica bacterium]|nr:acyl-ACP--UDP-N-acetylglucosamine O-acyltransferase [Candidatus Omnitrophota bacterium]
MIHNTAIVSQEAKLGKNVKVGPFAIIDGDVVIGDNVEIGPKVHILDGTIIGNNNYIGEGTLIGNAPQDLKYKGGRSFVKIGNNNVIREYVTIHKSNTEGKSTIVGDNNFIMTMAHIAHDCVIGNNVIIVNYAGLSGHIHIDDYAFVSGLTAIHQNVRIGAHAMVGGGVRITKDVMPFVMVSEEPARVFGLNMVGLKRRGFSAGKIAILEKVYKIFFREKLLLKDALTKIEKEVEQIDEVKYFIEFAKNSKRGLIR